MWIASVAGFFSAVRAGRGRIMIRARSRSDLERLKKLAGTRARVIATPRADYPLRIVVPARVWRRALEALAADPEGYGNFKAEVAKASPAREATYHKAWAVLRDGIEAEGDWR